MVDPHDAADRIERRTQRILWISALAFIVWQIAYFALYGDAPSTTRNVDRVRAFGFVLWCGALLMLVARGGGLFAGAAVRELLDDELAQARRAQAYRNAFWSMLLVVFVGYILAHVTPLSALTLAHLTISAGVLIAVVTLAISNRR